jgi:hypothetical protein
MDFPRTTKQLGDGGPCSFFETPARVLREIGRFRTGEGDKTSGRVMIAALIQNP